MGAEKVKSKRFVGVYYRESDNPKKTYNGRRDKCFWVNFKVNGKLCWEKIGWASEGVTEQYANEKRLERLSIINAPETQEDEKLPKPKKRPFTFGEAANLYWTWAEAEGKHVGPEKSRYENHLKDDLAHLPLQGISAEFVLSMRKRLMDKMTPQSAKHVLALARRIINLSIRAGKYFGASPFGPQSIVTMPPVSNQCERFLSPEEAQKLIALLRTTSPQTADMAAVAFACGLRACEVFRIKSDDIDESTNTIYVTSKGGKRDAVHAPAAVIALLLAYNRAPGEYIFQRRNGERVKETYDSFRRAAIKLGLDNGEGKKGRVWFHTGRHSFASELAKQPDATIPEMMAATRHTRVEMLARYLHTGDRQLKAKLDGVASAFLGGPDEEK